jgi:hypothetical protein
MTTGKFICGITLLVIVCSSRVYRRNAMAAFTGICKLDKYESFDSATGSYMQPTFAS